MVLLADPHEQKDEGRWLGDNCIRTGARAATCGLAQVWPPHFVGHKRAVDYPMAKCDAGIERAPGSGKVLNARAQRASNRDVHFCHLFDPVPT